MRRKVASRHATREPIVWSQTGSTTRNRDHDSHAQNKLVRRPAITDVVAHHPTVTLFLARERLMELVKAHPKVFVDLYELAVKRDEETSTMASEEATETDDFVIV
jgi:hypothetical protein